MSQSMHARTGWGEEEKAILLHLVDSSKGKSLRRIFDEAAQQLKRKPNSIRNYYYSLKKTEKSFVPFTREETQALLHSVLLAQAQGESVRACVLRLAKGDKTKALRYQNKYRALLRTKEAWVKEMQAQIQRELSLSRPAETPEMSLLKELDKMRIRCDMFRSQTEKVLALNRVLQEKQEGYTCLLLLCRALFEKEQVKEQVIEKIRQLLPLLPDA